MVIKLSSSHISKNSVIQNQNWYLSAVPTSPSTNNSLETFNKIIKDTNTLRERLQLSKFLVVAKEMVNEWSTKYIMNPEENFIAKSPIITLTTVDKFIQTVKRDCTYASC